MTTLKLNAVQAAQEQGRREALARQKAEKDRMAQVRRNATGGNDGPPRSYQHSLNMKQGGSTGFTIRGGVSGKQLPRRSYWVQP